MNRRIVIVCNIQLRKCPWSWHGIMWMTLTMKAVTSWVMISVVSRTVRSILWRGGVWEMARSYRGWACTRWNMVWCSMWWCLYWILSWDIMGNHRWPTVLPGLFWLPTRATRSVGGRALVMSCGTVNLLLSSFSSSSSSISAFGLIFALSSCVTARITARVASTWWRRVHCSQCWTSGVHFFCQAED